MADDLAILQSARNTSAVESALRLAARGREVEARDAAREFEAMLVGQILKNATAKITEEGPLGGGPGTRLYQELFLEEAVRQSGGRLGFAQWIETHLQNRPTDSDVASSSGGDEEHR